MLENLQYAVITFGFLLPMNSDPLPMAEWKKMIQKTFDCTNQRIAEMLDAIDAAPAGTTITRAYGSKLTLCIPYAGAGS